MNDNEKLSGEILGTKFQIATTNIVQVLLILLIAGLGSLGYFQFKESRGMILAILAERQGRTEEQLKIIALSIRILDHNIANPENRHPINFPDELFTKEQKK